MKAKKIIFYLLAGFLGGCLPVMSLHPLYNDENVVFEKELLGTWMDDANSPEMTWVFSRPDESKMEYELAFSDKEGKKGVFTACLVKLQDRRFLDVFPHKFPSGQEDAEKMPLAYNAFFFIPVHTFIKVDTIEPKLTIRLTDDESFKKLIEDNQGVVRHELIKDGPIVLTASTKELQEFVLKYAEDDRLFAEGKNLVLKKAASAAETVQNEGKK